LVHKTLRIAGKDLIKIPLPVPVDISKSQIQAQNGVFTVILKKKFNDTAVIRANEFIVQEFTL